MARVFLSNETYNAATSGAQVFGAAGTEQVNVFSGTTGVSVASSVERVDLSGNIADYTFSSFGAAMTIRDSAGNIVATVSDSGGKSVVFADGALSAVYAGTTLSLGGVALTGTAAAIAPAPADIDATTTSDAPASTGGTTGGAAQTLTDGVDTFTGTAGADTFTADATVKATSSVADSIDGGAGNDTFRLFVDDTVAIALPGTLTNVETVYINNSEKYTVAENINISSNSGVQTIELDGGTTDSASGANERFVLTVADGQSIILDSVTDGSAANDTANTQGELEIASASSVTSLNVTFDGVGAEAALADLDVDVAGTGVTTLTVNSIGSTNYVGLVNSGGALNTLNVTGDQLFDASTDSVTTLTTIDASAATGGAKVNVTGSTLNVTATGGAGNDTFSIGGDLDTNDTIDGGAGTDTVVVTDATLNSGTANVVKGANGLTNVEVLGTSATGTITIDATVFTAVDSFTNTAAVTGSEGSGSATAPTDGVNFTFAAGDTFVVGADITGGAASSGTKGDGAVSNGADALEVAAKVNSGSDTVTIEFSKGSATTLRGGLGEEGSAGSADNEDGGAAINASSVETINIVTSSASDDVTLTGGATSGSGDAGASISVGANATINLSGAGDVNLGTIVTQGVAVDDLTINGSTMTGVLTVTTGAGNDVITGGSKADVITAGTGANTITGGAGADDFNFADSSSNLTAITAITDFALGAGNDIIDFTTAAGTYEALTSANATAIAADTTLAAATAQAFSQLAEHEVTAFVFGGDAYVAYNANDTGGANTYSEANGDVVVKLTGITDVSGLDATQIS